MIPFGDKLLAAMRKCPTLDLATAMTETLCFWEVVTSLDPHEEVVFGVAPLLLSPTPATAVFITVMDPNDEQPYVLPIATVEVPIVKVAKAWAQRARERAALAEALPNCAGWDLILASSVAVQHYADIRRALISHGLVKAGT